jgi:D-sedoheptulose 7-phosphate isomerase
LSVGGGDSKRGVSMNVVHALRLAKDRGAAIFGIVGRNGGCTADFADCCVVIPPLYPGHVTPHTEGVCAIVWHLLVSHPRLQRANARWESLGTASVTHA